MRKLVITIIALFWGISLSAQSDRFEINFDLPGVLSRSAYVTVFGDKDLIAVDLQNNMMPVENGKFKLSGTAKTAGVLRLSFGREDDRLMKMVGQGFIPVKCASLWIIIYPGAGFSVKGDLTGKNFVDVYPAENTGKGENDFFAELNRKMMPLINESGTLSVELSVKENELTPAQKAEIEKKLAALDVQTGKVRETFIHQHPSSVAALWLMEDMLVRSQIEPAALEVPLARVDKKYHNNYFYVTVKGRVDGAKSSAVGVKCPDIKGMDQHGKEISLGSLKGKYVILDFWGTWCGPCLSGMPHMKDFRDAHSAKVEILGIANDKDVEKWRACIEKNGMNWPNIMQGKGEQDYVAKFNVQGFPTKVLVSPDGVILHRESGESEDFYKKIEALIK